MGFSKAANPKNCHLFFVQKFPKMLKISNMIIFTSGIWPFFEIQIPKCCYIHQKHKISNKFLSKKSQKVRAFTVMCRFGDFRNFLRAVSGRFLKNRKSWKCHFCTKSPYWSDFCDFRKKHKKCKKFTLLEWLFGNFYQRHLKKNGWPSGKLKNGQKI